MNKRRANLTINPQLYADAQQLMALRHFDDFSSFVEQLIREEHERRQGAKMLHGQPTYPGPSRDLALNETPPPKPEKKPADGRRAARQ